MTMIRRSEIVHVQLRLPVELHRQLQALALSQHRSLHGHILHLLSEHARTTPPQIQLPLKETGQ